MAESYEHPFVRAGRLKQEDAQAAKTQANKARQRATDAEIFYVIQNPDEVYALIQSGQLTPEIERALKHLSELFKRPKGFEKFMFEYRNLDEQEGAAIAKLIHEYDAYVATRDQAEATELFNQPNSIQTLLDQIGVNLTPSTDYINTTRRIQTAFRNNIRPDNPPAGVAPWQCRIGAANFYIPPASINVTQTFRTGSLTGGVLRQESSVKFNSGHSETVIDMTIYFPNHENIWGFYGNETTFNWDPAPRIDLVPTDLLNEETIQEADVTSDQEIDFFLSSLRGLVTQFKYAPFLPIRNQYLNNTYGITGVTLLGMSVSTVDGFPFCLSVNLQMAKFNHKVYLPMLDDFNQAMHWGKFRQYMGHAAERMNSLVTQGFLVEKQEQPSWEGIPTDLIPTDAFSENLTTITEYEGPLSPIYNKKKDMTDTFSLYYPTSTPARIFAPDTSGFRQYGEDLHFDNEKWFGLLELIGIDAVDRVEFNGENFSQAFTSSDQRNERRVLIEFLKVNNIAMERMNSGELARFQDYGIAELRKQGVVVDDATEAAARIRLQSEWFYQIYEEFKADPFFSKLMENNAYRSGNFLIQEWKVPMEKLYVDWQYVHVNGVSVNMSNNIARLQVQLQDEPVHQHIGGGDTRVDISLTVIGELNLGRFRRVFDHINGLARLEHGHGVLGFLGIKSPITALCGVKYVLPMSFEVETVPNYPHVYNVRMSFVDFDVFQQKREELSSEQQLELIEAFGKRNPFLRIKQHWGAFNAYPDMPLALRDTHGKIVGHLDPDYYFRSFAAKNEDIFNWDVDNTLAAKLNRLESLKQAAAIEGDLIGTIDPASETERRKLAEEIKLLVRDNGVPQGYVLDASGNLRVLTYQEQAEADAARENGYTMRVNMGVFNEEQDKLDFVELYEGGRFGLGSQMIDASAPDEYVENGVNLKWEEDSAARTRTEPLIPGTIPPSEYMQQYADGTQDPTKQFELMMRDYNYRDLSARMVRAYPTYMLWLIDEGGRIGGVKLFDNFYGLQSVIDYSIVQSEDILGDTLVLRVSNVYSKLSTPYRDQIIADDNSLAETPIGRLINRQQDIQRNIMSGTSSNPLYVTKLDSIRLKPGVRVHMRMGYSANPNALQTVFNGIITQVEQGDIMTITAQSDAIELSPYVNTTNKNGHSGTIDGGINCFTADTKLNLWDGGTVTIGEVVNENIYPTLIGRDEDGNIVPAKVLAGYNFGPKDEWMRLKLANRIDPSIRADHNNMIVTPGHHIVINDQYSQAGHAKVGDKLITFKRTISDSVSHFIQSSLLGDGCIIRNGDNAFYKEAHSMKQSGYAQYLQQSLGDCAGKPEYYISGYGSNGIVVSSKTYSDLRIMRDIWYKDGVKMLPDDLSWIDDFTIAKWYMDDGSLGKRITSGSANFATNGFTENEVNRLAELLRDRYNVQTKVYFSKGWCLTVNKGKNNSIDTLWSAIAPYIYPDLRYKLPVEFHDIEFRYFVFNGEEIIKPVESEILEVEWLPSSDRPQGGGSKRKAYDITTSTGNYFSRGILVHNTGMWLSEPRDLMVRLLSMGSSGFKEWVSWSTQGMIFSENRFGIRHFGQMLYEPMSGEEARKQEVRYGYVRESVNQTLSSESVGALTGATFNTVLGEGAGLTNSPMIAIMQAMWINSFRKRDYELFKRNIYPGNGLGIAQFMGGDMIDAGTIAADAVPYLKKNMRDQVTTDEQIRNDLENAQMLSQFKVAQVKTDTEAALILNENTFKPPSSLVEDAGGLWGDLLDVASSVGDAAGFVLDVPGMATGWVAERLGDVPILGPIAKVADFAVGDLGIGLGPLGTAIKARTLFKVFTGTMNSPILKAMGVMSTMDDDDLSGYDETSFRAQTYMRSVWDLFKLCAALLPNYIVAVRPFEDRSTVFYGKPHWLYTSGLVPITTGVNPDGFPKVEESDEFMKSLLEKARAVENTGPQGAQLTADQAIAQLNNVTNPDPYAGSDGIAWTGGNISSLSLAHESGAVIAFREGKVAIEMHLPTSPDLQTDIRQHIQYNDLADNAKHPFYMDRVGGGVGGVSGITTPDILDDTTVLDGDDPNAPGKPGAFGYLSPQEEQFYMNMQWPYERGGGQTYAPTLNGVKRDMYVGRRILVYSKDKKKAVVCTPGDWGPGKKGFDSGFRAGLSPDTMHALGIKHGDVCQFGFVPDNTRLGPIAIDNIDEIPAPDNTGVIESNISGTGDIDVITVATRPKWLEKIINEEGEQKVPEAMRDGYRALLDSPMLFAFKFGYLFKDVPVWIDPMTGFGTDVYGENARKMYDEDYDSFDVTGNGRTLNQAESIWDQVRGSFKTNGKPRDIYAKYYPLGEGEDKYEVVVDMFLRFMWQIPSNRAWIVINISKRADAAIPIIGDLGGINDINPIIGDNDDEWDLNKLNQLFEVYISSTDHVINGNGVPYSASAFEWMKQHDKEGKSTESAIGRILEDGKDLYDETIGSLLSFVGDSISGFLSVVRLSLMQIGQGVSMAGLMQKQANILNNVFNDSIYYQMGSADPKSPDHILRLVDNPFTREYGEPVVETREPFQRVHFISSFQHILSNNVVENLNGVATVVTATSDGKYPVTVSFDKGISPERQTEKMVETGLFWDNARGSGLTAIFHPFLHPIETMRGISKTVTGSSDQLSSRKVALWHLKESLKDIYQGEIVILGNPDIRPHDLIYLADVYERMYGMFEVEQVVHHFTPETGFITSITPNAIVTVNDPARWSLISWVWSKFSTYNIRNDARYMLGVKANRESSLATGTEISSEDIPSMFDTQIRGSWQYTQGNTALMKDIAAMYTMGGIRQADKQADKVGRTGLSVGAISVAAPLIGGLAGGPIGFGVGLVLGDLVWKAWDWVRDHLLDQHGCYIQYMTRNGQPMDAGLAYFQGVAVGQHNSIALFPSALGVSGRVNTTDNGKYFIRSDDLLAKLGWQEVEIAALARETSWWVNQTNAKILELSGRNTNASDPANPMLHIAVKVGTVTEIVDGDTIHVSGIDQPIRLLIVNTPELPWKDNQSTTDFDESTLNNPNDPAYKARQYLMSAIMDKSVAIRYDKRQMFDQYGRILAVVFHNVPLDTPPNRRETVLEILASREPTTPWDGYLEDGRPYTINWELVMSGHGNVDMRSVIQYDKNSVIGLGEGNNF